MPQRDVLKVLFVYGIVVVFWGCACITRTLQRSSSCTAVIDQTWVDIKGWSIGHFFHYMILGFIVPRWWLCYIAAGVAFELVELLLSKWSEYVHGAVVKDTIINTIGVMTGVGLRAVLQRSI